MMTIQSATLRAITKVETGDYDMMDEVCVFTTIHDSVRMTDRLNTHRITL